MAPRTKRQKAVARAQRNGGRYEKATFEGTDVSLEMPNGPTIEQEDWELLGISTSEIIDISKRGPNIPSGLSWKEGADHKFRSHYNGSSRATYYRKRKHMAAALEPTSEGKAQTTIQAYLLKHPLVKDILCDTHDVED